LLLSVAGARVLRSRFHGHARFYVKVVIGRRETLSSLVIGSSI
jgi:hypothetical protein